MGPLPAQLTSFGHEWRLACWQVPSTQSSQGGRSAAEAADAGPCGSRGCSGPLGASSSGGVSGKRCCSCTSSGWHCHSFQRVLSRSPLICSKGSQRVANLPITNPHSSLGPTKPFQAASGLARNFRRRQRTRRPRRGRQPRILQQQPRLPTHIAQFSGGVILDAVMDWLWDWAGNNSH